MRLSTCYFIMVTGCLTLLGLLLYHARSADSAARSGRLVRASLVKELQLTDLCIFTEARYTRHPAMADLHSPFQDGPVSFEHFPSGSMIPPPAHLRGTR